MQCNFIDSSLQSSRVTWKGKLMIYWSTRLGYGWEYLEILIHLAIDYSKELLDWTLLKSTWAIYMTLLDLLYHIYTQVYLYVDCTAPWITSPIVAKVYWIGSFNRWDNPLVQVLFGHVLYTWWVLESAYLMLNIWLSTANYIHLKVNKVTTL